MVDRLIMAFSAFVRGHILRYSTTVSPAIYKKRVMYFIEKGVGFVASFSSVLHSTLRIFHRTLRLLTEPTTPTIGKGPDNVKEVALLELGPVLVHEEEFRVRHLPQQKVAEPVLAGRSDQDVGIGTV